MFKKCSKCRQEKVLSEFNLSKSGRLGYHNYCRVCSKSHFKSWTKQDKIQSRMDFKFCESCKIEKISTEFSKNLNGKDGLHSKCKGCFALYHKLKRTNPAYKEKLKIVAAKYTKDNKEAANVKSAQRRAHKLQRVPKWVDQEFEDLFISEAYDLARLRELSTNFKWQIDHQVPFISNFVCGLHCAENLCVISAKENLSKGNKYWPDMW